jgi:hypothetical protein
VWKIYTLPEPQLVRMLSNGKELLGPAGASVWNTPTVDAKCGLLYFTTGNAFVKPKAGTTNAVMAVELDSGKTRWVTQVLEGDIWSGGCEPKRDAIAFPTWGPSNRELPRIAGIDIAPHQRPKLERLCRYVTRPPVATERMALTSTGHVRYALKTPYRDGTTHIVLEPLDFMARLAALVPPPRMHLTRYHGVFAPHSKLRSAVTPAHRGTGASKQPATAAESVKPPTPRHVAMSWARRLKRVFGIEIDDCGRCGGRLKVIASIEEPEVIAKILAHLKKTAPDQYQPELPLGERAPPSQASLL